jgi:hypothetical protein
MKPAQSTDYSHRTLVVLFAALVILGCGKTKPLPTDTNTDTDSGTVPDAPDTVDPTPDGTDTGTDTAPPVVTSDPKLCRPCLEDSQCDPSDVAPDKSCVDFGPEGRFCLPACSDDADCDDGYTCTDTGEEGSNKSCWPTSGQCACSDQAITQGASTICYAKNAIGTCIGSRECGPEGLNACSAKDAAVEVCDGVDNNCDGDTDEGTDALPCGQGDPAYPCGGQTQCIAGTKVCEPFPPVEEVCDLLDNDCDGEIDEDYPGVGEACDGPDDDLCKDGILACAPDKLGTVCTKEGSGPGAKEICDGIDNDCDGHIDENFPEKGQACDGPDDDLCKDGVITCTVEGTSACAETTPPGTVEICDGVDNDCDGSIDEGLLNACGTCGDVPKEICDGKDNNCNGNIDEGLLNICGTCGDVPVEICDNIDNDCDGNIDEENVCTPPVEAVLVLDGLSGALRRSFDKGQTWDTVGTVPFKKVAMIPSITRIEEQTLFAAAYQQVKDSSGNYVYDGPHVMRSDNGGANWTDIGAWGQNTNPKASPVALCSHPASGLPIYGTDKLGDLYRSDDGLNFNKSTTWTVQGSMIACAVGYDGALFAHYRGFCDPATGPCADFWISTDGGSSMNQSPSPTQPGNYSNAVIATSKKHAGHVYVRTAEQTIVHTPDSGNSWVPLVSDVPTGPKPVSGITLDANGTIYVATVTSASGSKPCDPSGSASGCAYYGGQFYHSTDQGQLWVQGADWLDGGNGSGWLSMTTALYPAN